jgi:SPP1 gp7 family putative phage head morphogenesis protein
MRLGKPVIFKNEYYASVEEAINAIFAEKIYNPLRRALKGTAVEILNNQNELIDAIIRGQVYYENGRFHGNFNSKISKALKKLGAQYSRAKKSWGIPRAELPMHMIGVLQQSDAKFKQMSHEVIKVLDNVQLDDLPLFNYANTIERIDTDFKKSLEGITITPKLTPDMTRVISEEWGSNLKLYIRDWAEENILKLREEVQLNALSGQRAGNLVKLLQTSCSESKNKAKFLARQETSLLMSKMRETRYASVGIRRYKWKTAAQDERVRPMHRELNNKIFDFSEPPITDKNGNRNNPGEDYGCRCIAIPVIEGV